MTKAADRLNKARRALFAEDESRPCKRLFFDIETSPNIGFFWRPGFKLTIGHDNIIKERAIICISWKWAGAKLVSNLKWDKNQCDKKLLTHFIKILHEADEIVGHNGDQFDTKWIRGRALKHGLEMSPTFMSLDTLKISRRLFNINSHKLDYLADYLGIGRKKPTGFGLWRDITLNNDKKAMATMVDYCNHDVVLLEQVWDRLNQYTPAKTHVGLNIGECPECGSDQTHIRKHSITAGGTKKTQLQCKQCNKYFTVSTPRLLKLRGW